MGFRHILRDQFPHIQIVELREIMDDRVRAQTETKALLALHPDVAAIYNVGGGTSGIATELQARGLDPHVVLLCHEVTENNKAFLLNGTIDAVIDQNPRVEAREASPMPSSPCVCNWSCVRICQTTRSSAGRLITLRRQRLCGKHIALQTGASPAKISRVLRRAGLSRMKDPGLTRTRSIKCRE